MLNEFKTFIARGNVLDLAVGVVIGTAFTAIVTSLVGDIINPLIGLIAGGVDFSLGAGFFGTDEGETGVAGLEIGGELLLHGDWGVRFSVGVPGWRFWFSQRRHSARELWEKSTWPVSASWTSHCWVESLKRMSVARTTWSRPSARRSIASV